VPPLLANDLLAFCGPLLDVSGCVLNIIRTQPHINKFNRSEIYCMKCLDCPKNISGKREEPSIPDIRSKEHIYDIRSNNSNTGYANHILNTGHTN
jgi:hypothetical protein